jgi:Rrf2 family protein
MAKNCRFAVAVHIATVLAMTPEHLATSEWLADSVNTNPVVVRRILSALAKAGLVCSQRGSTGGSVLGKRPEAISLLDVYRAVEHDKMPAVHNQEPNPACPVGANILPVLVDILDRAERAKMQELEKVSVADVVTSIRARLAMA